MTNEVSTLTSTGVHLLVIGSYAEAEMQFKAALKSLRSSGMVDVDDDAQAKPYDMEEVLDLTFVPLFDDLTDGEAHGSPVTIFSQAILPGPRLGSTMKLFAILFNLALSSHLLGLKDASKFGRLSRAVEIYNLALSIPGSRSHMFGLAALNNVANVQYVLGRFEDLQARMRDMEELLRNESLVVSIGKGYTNSAFLEMVCTNLHCLMQTKHAAAA